MHYYVTFAVFLLMHYYVTFAVFLLKRVEISNFSESDIPKEFIKKAPSKSDEK
jgi:hypothetical protein